MKKTFCKFVLFLALGITATTFCSCDDVQGNYKLVYKITKEPSPSDDLFCKIDYLELLNNLKDASENVKTLKECENAKKNILHHFTGYCYSFTCDCVKE